MAFTISNNQKILGFHFVFNLQMFKSICVFFFDILKDFRIITDTVIMGFHFMSWPLTNKKCWVLNLWASTVTNFANFYDVIVDSIKSHSKILYTTDVSSKLDPVQSPRVTVYASASPKLPVSAKCTEWPKRHQSQKFFSQGRCLLKYKGQIL